MLTVIAPVVLYSFSLSNLFTYRNTIIYFHLIFILDLVNKISVFIKLSHYIMHIAFDLSEFFICSWEYSSHFHLRLLFFLIVSWLFIYILNLLNEIRYIDYFSSLVLQLLFTFLIFKHFLYSLLIYFKFWIFAHII